MQLNPAELKKIETELGYILKDIQDFREKPEKFKPQEDLKEVELLLSAQVDNLRKLAS